MKFTIGQRIRISPNYTWAKGAFGTIAYPWEFAVEMVKDETPWDGCHRFVKRRKEIIELYWVE